MRASEPRPEPAELLRGVALVTGNPDKIAEARRLCGLELETIELELSEIQSLDLEEVLRDKGEEAYRRLQRPLIVEETSLELMALDGFPGPLVKWMLAAIGPEGIARTAASLGDTRATARCQLLLVDSDKRHLAEGITRGRLVLPPRGEGGFGWDPVFQPREETRTYAEITGDEKDRLSHRGRAWRQLLEHLRSGGSTSPSG